VACAGCLRWQDPKPACRPRIRHQIDLDHRTKPHPTTEGSAEDAQGNQSSSDLVTEMAKSRAAEKPGTQRAIDGGLARSAVNRGRATTFENNEKIWPQPDRENAFAKGFGWGAWIRTRTNGVRVRGSTVNLLPSSRASVREAIAECNPPARKRFTPGSRPRQGHGTVSRSVGTSLRTGGAEPPDRIEGRDRRRACRSRLQSTT
jgi:hypothetical protein